MSLILDALNRSREESDPVPGLGTRHGADTAPAPWRRYLPWSALLVALIVIVYLLFERGGPASEPVAVLSPVSAPREQPPRIPEPGSQDQPRTAAREKRPSVAEPATPAKVEPVSEPATTVDPAVARLYEQPVAVASPPEPEMGSADDALPVQPTEQAAAAPLSAEQEETQVDIEQMVRRAQEEIDNARLAEHSAPFVSELSQQTKDAIPTVYYQRHDYAGDEANSRVVLNGQVMGKGGSPASGMRVVEILPDSVVLNYRGTEFRLRALNSWINL